MRPKAQRHTASFYASATFGMAFLWLVLKSQIYTSFFSSTVSEAASGQSNYYLYLIAMTLLCACAIVIRRPLEIKLLTNPVFIIVLSAMGAAGALTMYLLGGDFGQLRIVYLIGMTLLAAASFALLLSWSILLAKTDATTGIRCGILAYALGFVLHILLGFVGNTVIVVGLLCSGLFCSGLLRSARKASTLSRVDESFAPAQRPKAPPPPVVMVLVLFLFLGSVIRGILFSGSVMHSLYSSRLMDVISIAFTLLIFVIVLLSNWNWRTSILLWLVLSLFFFAGLFVVAILGLSLNDMGTHIIIPARTLLSFYLWLVLVLETKNRRASMVLALTVFYFGTELASAVVSYVVMPSFATQLSALSDGYGIAITIGVMFVLIVSSLLFLGIILLKREETGYESEKVVVEAGAGQERLTLDICRGLIPAYGLTTREAEIMALIARGHSVKKIAEVLTISPTTVQSHSRSLYRKLDVHDRQQIIDLVDNLLTR